VRRALSDRFLPWLQAAPLPTAAWPFLPPRILPAPAPAHPTLLPPPPFLLRRGAPARAAAGCSLVWRAPAPRAPPAPPPPAELVESGSGRRAGVTAAVAASGNPKARCGACRLSLLARYRRVAAALGRAEAEGRSYGEMKRDVPEGYAAARAALLGDASPLAAWTRKPEGEQDFC